MTYTSGLLGVPVARASLLALADQLASSHSGLEGRILRLEGHDEEGTVLVENDRRGRRLRLSHGYWPGVRRLCQQTGCRHELARYRTLCDTHMKAAGPSAVREQTTLVAEELRMDREAADFNASEAMRQLMEAALAVGIPAAGHARYFAERLHLADAETAEDWEYDEHEHEIRQDEVRLLLCIGTQLQREQTPVDRGAARPIGPADPRQLPGSPDHLTLDFSCTTGGMPLGRVDDDIQYWQVGVHHRVPDTARRTGERDRGQVGQLALLRVGWGQDTHLLDGTDAGFNTGLTARAAYDAVDDPSSAIHQLGLRAEGDLLLLLTVELDPAWRGFGLGAFLARQALHVLGRGCRVVATTCVEDADSPTGRLMLAAGFRPVSPLLAVLDPSSSGQTVQERLLHRHHLDRLVTLRDPDRDAEPPL
ncbi:hypothetical protein [Streptomyces rishiriensis]|uniref:hypothetical protein n=1 Tax=Streptomyces rishiriensis TaxID=68264 RepID=UPI00131EFA68|nr:hypothetical protein [Streptomyces rishiriensis]